MIWVLLSAFVLSAGLADLERIEGPFLNALTASDPEGAAAVMLRSLLARMASTSKRVMLAMVLDHVDADGLGLCEGLIHEDVQSPAEA